VSFASTAFALPLHATAPKKSGPRVFSIRFGSS
jgi:hypothetical protein